ncbi:MULTISPECIES: ABC transporter ATP-binding protein [unclassified Mesorhizobium]|uniref:ABC transporter ATP-binding protein n=1 Tax=unclassified Mesorhizobium TaxID=325217 RepID=UPI000FDAEA1F|nr:MULTISPECIES: ABC transporter ATP-binding protein [unclassified Mesorhizobium]TGQ39754.1 ABC transporter ATP-binding protein [Mesorhizobium sp. M00.F.Ca.ET.216.01.1.1]TIS57807.1 MAG: ATP-binding cassette domain-containing protein [Mesorhizobium sp.]TIS90450.1 MAG: ATP-binding cassette domain-containing protein [Mesorhizobium sp.]TJW13321.1 MAG: ATP-binding cassette domain-containing protein [Mesorhizobium sp.]TJW46584.1 MAG: ATP-binding cassette domain-containing protein [Mesorhizobium sp.]
MSTTLTADNIVTGYGKQEIVHGVSLSAEAGKITCIFGPNGSGKSTLLKAIVGALPVWSGTASLGDATLSNLAVHEVVRQGLVLMPQGGGVFPRLTVMENLRMGGYAIADRRLVEQRIEALIEQYPSLARRRRTAAGSLSGGEQAMLALARALVSEPRFILLDEPSAGLSPAMVIETLERITTLIAHGIGIVMVEQNIREAMPIADKLYILAAGEKRFEGTPRDVRDDRQIMDIYMGGA